MLPSAPEIPGATHLHSGKVRDLYELTEGPHEGRLLMVASDRISIFDFVLDTTIPDKGELLTRMSLWWFEQLADLVPNHVVSTDVPEQVRGRAVICERLEMYPVECVARGYLTGSGLLDYRATSGQVCGIALPAGLEDGSRLAEPIFTPATKADLGEHDENVSYDAVVETVGAERADELRRLTLDVYARAEGIARERGIILADTKLEFGARGDGTTVLGDEVLTPDSSRFWPAAEWQPGRAQPSYDKQIVRNWALSPESGWDRASGEAPPPLPAEVVERTRARYVEAYELLTGTDVLMPAAAAARSCSGAAARSRSTTSWTRATARVAVLAAARSSRSTASRGSGQTWVDETKPGIEPRDADHRARPARALERVRHLAVRPRRPDPRLRRRRRAAAATCTTAFRVHALGPLGAAGRPGSRCRAVRRRPARGLPM